MSQLLKQYVHALTAADVRLHNGVVEIRLQGLQHIAELGSASYGKSLKLKNHVCPAKTGWARHFLEEGWYAIAAVRDLAFQVMKVVVDFTIGDLTKTIIDVFFSTTLDTSSEEIAWEEDTAVPDFTPAAPSELALREQLAACEAVAKKMQRKLVRVKKQQRDEDGSHCELAFASPDGLLMRAGRYLNVHEGCRMVLRKSASGLSARRTGTGLGFDIHGTTVGRWEVLLCAALICDVRAWYASMEDIYIYIYI
jgi:hypothetical protein